MNRIKSLTIETVCPFCGQVNFVTVDYKSYCAWQAGLPVQEVFPNMSAQNRELLVSGVCDDCWDTIFVDSTYDDDEHCEIEFEDCYDEVGYDPYMGCYTDDC